MGKRSILIAGVLGLVLGSGWLAWWVQQKPQAEAPVRIVLADETARADFLASQGYAESHCVAAEEVRVPVSVSDTYKAYAVLQDAQRLPLASHLGEPATRYTYVQNSSGQASLRTELLLDKNQVVIGAMQYDPANPEIAPLLQNQ